MRHMVFGLVAVATIATLAPAARAGNASFTALADRYWDESLADGPESATYRGVHKYDDRLSDFSPAAMKKRIAWRHAWRDRFAAFDKKGLGRDELADLESMRLDNYELGLRTIVRYWEALRSAPLR